MTARAHVTECRVLRYDLFCPKCEEGGKESLMLPTGQRLQFTPASPPSFENKCPACGQKDWSNIPSGSPHFVPVGKEPPPFMAEIMNKPKIALS